MTTKLSFCRRGAAFAAGIVLLAATTATTATDADAAQGDFKLGLGMEYTTGDYGTGQDTDILYVPVRFQYMPGRWIFGITVPYIEITGNGDVTGGSSGPIVTNRGRATGAGRSTQSGLGDVILRVSYAIVQETRNAPLIDLTGKIKVPTADEDKGLGTGEFDYTFQVDVSKKFGKITPFGTLGYQLLGESGGAINLNDVFLFSLGATYAASNTLSVGLKYDYREATTANSGEKSELSPYAVFKMSKSVSLNLYGIYGLEDGSPDYGAGAMLSVSW